MLKIIYNTVERKGLVQNNKDQCIYCGKCEKLCPYHALLFQGNWKQQVPCGENSGTNRGMPLVSIASCVREASTYPCQRHCCNNFRHFLSYLLTAVFYLIYKKGRKTNKLTVNDRCIKYEICEKSCPHQAITIQNGRLLGCSAM